MEMENLIRVKRRQELFFWVIVSVTKQPGVIQYLDAVEEALCFRWIDGVKKIISNTELAQRLSPRKKKK